MGHLKPFGSANKVKTIGGNVQMLSNWFYSYAVCMYEKKDDCKALCKSTWIIVVWE
jgi:hypothetical protein